MDLDFVYKQLLDGHKACKTTLSLTRLQRERLIGLASILYLSLQNCSTVTMVKTSIYNVNTKCAADTYTKFLLWYYLRVRIMLCSPVFEWTGYVYWAETKNKMIIWKNSSSGDDNIKSKFVSVIIPPRNGNAYFLVFITKRHCFCIITILCSQTSAQIKIQNLLQILLTFTVQIYIRHMSNLMLFRTVALRAI